MNRLQNLDNIKFLAAFLVICIHVNFQEGGIIIKSIARIAVPLFILISGYFFPILSKENKSFKFLKKIIILTISANIFYFLTNILIFNINLSPMNWDAIYKSIIFNESFPNTAIHLWYLNAIIYTISFAIICSKYLPNLFFLIPILLAVGYIISSITTNNLFYRNFIFLAIPYFMTGSYLQYNKEKISVFIKKISKNKLLVLFIIEIILLGVEIFIYQQLKLPVYRDHYFMTLPMALTIFVGVIFILPENNIKFITYIGQKYSSGIYIFHVFTMNILANLTLKFFDIRFDNLYYINVFIIFIATIILLYLYHLLKKFITFLVKTKATT